MNPTTSSSPIVWRRQGAAIVGVATLPDGRVSNIVLVGARNNPKGAAVILPAENGPPQTRLLSEAIGLFHSQQIVDILCMQERAFGQNSLPTPAGLDAAT